MQLGVMGRAALHAATAGIVWIDVVPMDSTPALAHDRSEELTDDAGFARQAAPLLLVVDLFLHWASISL
jgi:hypothetical protein